MVENPQNSELMGKKTLVIGCIDFRTIEKARETLRAEYGLSDGDYTLVTTAGAALNPQTSNLLPKNLPVYASVINFNHKDCGYAKQTGSDRDERHQSEMDEFGKKLTAMGPNIEYHPELIRLEPQDLERHQAQAVALIEGDPAFVQQSREKMDAEGLTGEKDEISRETISPDDASFWTDFQISLKLHDPKTAYIFVPDAKKAQTIKQKAEEEGRKLGKQIEVITNLS